MATKMTATITIFALFAFLNFGYVRSNPAIDGVKSRVCTSGKSMSSSWAALRSGFYITRVPLYARVIFQPCPTGFDPMEICIENCAQCKKMLGAWFEGPLCAESCIKFKGKLIPECEDFASIAPFLNKL